MRNPNFFLCRDLGGSLGESVRERLEPGLKVD